MVEVDSGLFNVTITVPATFVEEGATQESLDATAKEEGYKSITLNEDGSATYVMTKAKHKEMMDELRQQVNDSLEEMILMSSPPLSTKTLPNSPLRSTLRSSVWRPLS